MSSKVAVVMRLVNEDEDDDEFLWEDELRVIFTVKLPYEESAAVMTPFRISRRYLTSDNNKNSNNTIIPMLLSHTKELPPQFFNDPSIIRRVSAAAGLVPSGIRRMNVLLRPSKENETLCYIKCFWHVSGEEFCDIEPNSRPILGAKRGTSCRICLEELRLGLNATYLPCSHVFHGGCVARWLEKYCNSCPLCRCRLVGQ